MPEKDKKLTAHLIKKNCFEFHTQTVPLENILNWRTSDVTTLIAANHKSAFSLTWEARPNSKKILEFILLFVYLQIIHTFPGEKKLWILRVKKKQYPRMTTTS